MANSLLDFVISLVRDPDAAARYAADPAQAIADAHLTDVSSVDVNNLIPVVTESLSMANPSAGLDGVGAEPASNVWASGAATAAFDAFGAFDDHAVVPAGNPVVFEGAPVISDPVERPTVSADASPATAWVDELPSPHVDAPVLEDPSVTDGQFAGGWEHPVPDEHPVDHPDSFDLFD
ncbi:Rv0340 family IniB-related protein [Mycobacterium sp. WMMD1722]|uniref:Rv0340 family IniB-related protein n=1 Tax=Mycobacterium sp. WMMD1722 TaxID=3404117 RepID=UPI003BF5DE12